MRLGTDRRQPQLSTMDALGLLDDGDSSEADAPALAAAAAVLGPLQGRSCSSSCSSSSSNISRACEFVEHRGLLLCTGNGRQRGRAGRLRVVAPSQPHRLVHALADRAVQHRQASQPQTLFPAPGDRGVQDHQVLSRLMHAGKAKRRAERLRDEESAAKVRLMASVSDGLILCSMSPFV